MFNNASHFALQFVIGVFFVMLCFLLDKKHHNFFEHFDFINLFYKNRNQIFMQSESWYIEQNFVFFLISVFFYFINSIRCQKSSFFIKPI